LFYHFHAVELRSSWLDLSRRTFLAISIYTARRKIVWGKIRGFGPVASLGVATALGAGLFPVAPGTMGTLIGVPLAYWSTDWPVWGRVLLWAGLVAIGTWSATTFDQLMGTKDNQNIVIDEVIGLGIASWTAGRDFKSWVAAFLLFRVFDIIKIPPVRQLDAWSKKKSNPTWGGFGVIADDMAAGLQALACLVLLQWTDFFRLL
jgi:phosphatidylglycerophosphatase A